MAIKTVKRTIALGKLVSSDAVNVRLASNYDLATMESQIVAKGGVTTPLTVEATATQGVYTILRGNRRYRACQVLVGRESTSPELREAIQRLDCEVIDEVITEAQRLAIILDHGETKGLTRLETVLAVWKLDAQMFSEKMIGEMMYYQLAQYTGNLGKLAGLAALKEPVKRAKYLNTWFRGTLGNKILLANRLGGYVREQFVLTTRAEEHTLPEGTTVDCTMSQERLAELNKARLADTEAEGWDADKGGTAFNTLLQHYRDIDTGRADKPKNERPTAKALEDYANTIYKSAPIRAALLVAAGKSDYGKGLPELDAAIYRWTLASEILAKRVTEVVDPNVRALITAILGSGPAADVETALDPFFAALPDGESEQAS